MECIIATVAIESGISTLNNTWTSHLLKTKVNLKRIKPNNR